MAGSRYVPKSSAVNSFEGGYLLSVFQPTTPIFGSDLPARLRRAIAAGMLFAIASFGSLPVPPAGAFDLFATHEVTAQFATPDGKPMADAEVRVFAPGDPGRAALTGHTDAEGKFVFDADRDGFWSAEARSPDYVARVMIRVGGEAQPQNWRSPIFLVGFLVVLLAIAVWYRLLRARTRPPRS